VTTLLGDVAGENVRVQGFTVTGDVDGLARCATLIDDTILGRIVMGGAGLCYDGLVSSCDVGAGITVFGGSLIWGNTVRTDGIAAGGEGTALAILRNSVLGGGVGIQVIRNGTVEDNLVSGASTGIKGIVVREGLNLTMTGNTIIDCDTGVFVAGSENLRNFDVVDNTFGRIFGIGIDYEGSPFSQPIVIVGNLLNLGTVAQGSVPAGTAVRVIGSGTIAGNTIVGGATGVRIDDASPTRGGPGVVDLLSNIIGFSSGSGVWRTGAAVVTAASNDVLGNAPDWQDLESPNGLKRNISLDPVFRDPSVNDWSLDASSPCIDMGLSTNVPYDLAGNPRAADGDGDGIAVEDMGAYELPANADPECGVAVAVVKNLWPPNHQMTPIAITGVSDPDGDLVTIEATGVTQDEPVGDHGTGDTSPDARILEGQAQVRAERSGEGNGRVYRISFRAEDGRGGQCEGAVTVCVPHDLRPGGSCLDDSQRFNSLESAERAMREGAPGVAIQRN